MRRLRALEERAVQPPGRLATLFAYGFVLVAIVSQLALAFTELAALRIVARVAVYGASVALLALPRTNGARHPAAKPAMWIFGIVMLSLLHPLRDSWTSALAQAGLYVAVLGPLFWVPRVGMDAAVFRRVILILWVFGTASAAVGILQVYVPGQFQPNLSTIVAQQQNLNQLYIVTAAGELVVRPMGLTDLPGGAALGGFYAVLFGTGFLLTSRRPIVMVIAPVTVVIGLTIISLSYVRVFVVAAVIFLAALGGILVWRRRVIVLGRLGIVTAAALAMGLGIALSLGGTALEERLSTLLEEPPGEIYYASRGRFLEHTWSELTSEFPLGAGLGRWGMTNLYFGDVAERIWVEIQWTGWLLDGGFPLVIASVVALAAAMRVAWALSRRSGPTETGELAIWAGIIAAYDITAVALTFNSPFFASQAGMEFWFLNAALFAAARRAPQSQHHPA